MMPDKKAAKQILFTGQAAEKLLEYRFNTEEDKLPEMTAVSAREAFMMAGIKTINEIREYQAQLSAYFIYLGVLSQRESYQAKAQLYGEYKNELKAYNKLRDKEGIESPKAVSEPLNPAKPELAEKPIPFFASDRFNFWLMKFKRSVGARGLDAAEKLSQVGLEVSGEVDDLGDTIEAP